MDEAAPTAYGALQLKPWEFGRLTLKEFAAMVEGWNWRAEQQAQLLLWQAWHTAALERMKRLPKFDELVGSVSKRRTAGEPRIDSLIGLARAKGLKGPW